MNSEMKMSGVMQTVTMLCILASFGMANFNQPGAVTLWTSGGEAIGMLIAFGIGLKMAQNSVIRYIDQKYGKTDSSVDQNKGDDYGMVRR